ncbi:SCP2 sterol-binding domain-containing protein [Chelatococcus sp. SYSU_G07232]|uniref:SCP2 sterol-binding domain-containing protein n=1 Tax=Chelatococcus albus TaxID=3047466 RepID=A0ABT7AHB0_9HYPH|nr:SCP2 sterol-binding domain-containing protein [Chelatococcus sp. SYSU_G07232]MDJ1158214.1 SCP2 sterol-binding domain-containing protein [Chelatococcus sp. SYSU_G07232]
MPISAAAVPTVPFLVSLAVRPLPLGPLQPLLAGFMAAVTRRHPRIFERLGPHAGKRFGLDPTDLPLAFVLAPDPACPRAVAVRELPAGLDARIAGPLAGLVGQLDGSYDGDALFFSRDIVVEGDMEAVLALRNALDDAQIDVARLAAAALGPFGAFAEPVLRGALRAVRTDDRVARRDG